MYQAGLGAALEHSRLAESGRDAAQRSGVIASVAVVAAVVVLASVVLSVLRSLVTYGNLVLRRDADVLAPRARAATQARARSTCVGCAAARCVSRCWSGCLARALDAVMTGVAGAGEASLLLPPARSTAESVLAELIHNPDAVSLGPVPARPPHAQTLDRALSAACGRRPVTLIAVAQFVTVPDVGLGGSPWRC